MATTPGQSQKTIFFVIPSLGAGGAERVAVNLCKGLSAARWHPVFVTLLGGGAYARELPPHAEHIDLGKHGWWDNPATIVRLARLLRERQPDLIHTRIYFMALITWLARAIARSSARQVSAVDNTLSLSLEDERLTGVRRWMCRRVLPRNDHLVATSRGVRDDLVRNFRVPQERCAVISNGVDVGVVRRRMREALEADRRPDEGPLLVAAGRLVPQKNYPLLLRAFALVRESIPARLLILGEGREKQKLVDLTRSLGVRDAVEFCGFVNNPFKYFRAADLFVMSSDWEGFGNVVIEAMACGTPVVSTRYRHGAEEIITDGTDGLLVPCGDEEALAEAIRRVLEDEALRRELGAVAYGHARDFDNAKIARQYEELFLSVLGCSDD